MSDKIIQAGIDAERLKKDPAFVAFLQEVRDAQLEAFAESGASDKEAREEAHAILRALAKLENVLEVAISRKGVEEHKQKGQERQ